MTPGGSGAALVETIGHSTRPVDAFIRLLERNGVGLVADVRAFPRSRRNPAYNIDRLPETLAAAGIAYRHFPGLGGRRSGAAADDGLVGLWREPGFRNFAGYALTAAFRDSLEALLGLAGETRVAVMCAEAVWWRCHRRIIADYLIVAGAEVRHILGDERVEPARLTPGAAPRPDGTILYPSPQPRLI